MLKSSTHGSLQNGVLGIENKLERNSINQWTQICTRLWKSHRVNLPQNKTMVHCATMIKKNSQPHLEEMVLSSQPLLLRSGAWMTVKRMKTHTNM